MKTPRRVCVLVSGGLDSSLLTADYLAQGVEVHPLYVSAGLHWEKAERIWLRRLLKALAGPRLKPLAEIRAPATGVARDHWSLTGRGVPPASGAWDSVYLPGRNLLLFSHAGLHCHQRGIGRLAIGLLKGNPFSDATPGFRRCMEEAVRRAVGWPIEILAPYSRLSKAQALSRVPGFPVELTFSCLRPKGLAHCRACSKCEERRRALARAD